VHIDFVFSGKWHFFGALRSFATHAPLPRENLVLGRNVTPKAGTLCDALRDHQKNGNGARELCMSEFRQLAVRFGVTMSSRTREELQ
jgi:hypothetical protein